MLSITLHLSECLWICRAWIAGYSPYVNTISEVCGLEPKSLNEVTEDQWLQVLIIIQLKRIMEEDAKKLLGFKAYNILPLETPGVANSFQSFPEVLHLTLILKSIVFNVSGN